MQLSLELQLSETSYILGFGAISLDLKNQNVVLGAFRHRDNYEQIRNDQIFRSLIRSNRDQRMDHFSEIFWSLILEKISISIDSLRLSRKFTVFWQNHEIQILSNEAMNLFSGGKSKKWIFLLRNNDLNSDSIFFDRHLALIDAQMNINIWNAVAKRCLVISMALCS